MLYAHLGTDTPKGKYDVIKELPKEWNFTHRLFEYYLEGPVERDILVSVDYIPVLYTIVVKNEMYEFQIANSKIESLHFFTGKYTNDNQVLASVITSDFLVSASTEIIKEFKMNFIELLDFLKNNEEHLEEIPIKEVSEEEELKMMKEVLSTRTTMHPDIIFSNIKEDCISFEGFHPSLDNLLPDFVSTTDNCNNCSFENTVKLYSDYNNKLFVIARTIDVSCVFPLEMDRKEVQKLLLKNSEKLYTYGGVYISLIYYKYLSFRKYQKYYKVTEDLSIYSEDAPIGFDTSLGEFIVNIGEQYIRVALVPVQYQLDEYYSIIIERFFDLDPNKRGLIERFFMRRDHAINLIALLIINEKDYYSEDLYNKVARLFDICKERVESVDFDNLVREYHNSVKNVIEVSYYYDTKEFIYRRYKDNIRKEATLNRYTISPLLYNNIDLEEAEELLKLRGLLKEKELKEIPSNISFIQKAYEFFTTDESKPINEEE